MARQRYLSKAPITEALIAFQVSQSPDQFEVSKTKFLKSIAANYYEKGPIATGTVQIDASVTENVPGITAKADRQIIGVRLHSHDEKYVVQFTIHGLTLSRLQPYEGWEKLRDEMRRLWHFYPLTSSTTISRVSVRYINIVHVPTQEPPVLFESVLLTPPKEPEGMPETMSSFLSRNVIEDPGKTDCSVIVTIASQLPQPDALPVLLDIEVARRRTFSATGTEVWEFLEAMRDLKNRSFFGSLTEDTIAKYE